MSLSSLKNYTIFALFFTAAGLIALSLPAGNPAGPWLAGAYILGSGWLAGSRLFPAEPRPWRLYLGEIAFLSALTVLGSLVYYAYKLDLAACGAVVILTPFVFAAVRPEVDEASELIRGSARRGPGLDGKRFAVYLAGLALAFVSLALTVYGFILLAGAGTDQSIRSPWDAVPRMFFIVFLLAFLAAFALAESGAAGGLALLPVTALAMLAASVAAIVYSVGYGFDPFIHQATEAAIAKAGVITPKPLYYVGQYALVTLLGRASGIGPFGIDRWLVPVAFTLAVPCAYWSLRRAFAWPARTAAAASAALLLLPLAPFIASTPQGLADALTLMAVFLALPAAAGRRNAGPLPYLAAGAAVAVHPLAGIPLVAFMVILFFLGRRQRAGKTRVWPVVGLLTLAGSVALPLAFMVNSWLSGASVSLDASLLSAPGAVLEELRGAAVISRRYLAAFDFVYLWRNSRDLLILAAGVIGTALLLRRHRGAGAYAAGAVVYLANYILLKTVVDFPFLIDYERANYADRLLELALILMAAPAAYGLGRLLEAIKSGFPARRAALAVLVSALAVSSLYLAYPRRDQYESSRGWSTSAADIKAVRLIGTDAGSRSYAVLANQSVSAAAIREYGFKKYFDSTDPARPGKLFYYPVPTGDALYSAFLGANAAYGSPASIRQAMDLVGTDTVYYVVTNYWWQAQKIIVSSKRYADRWWNVDDQDFVFKYTRAGLESK